MDTETKTVTELHERVAGGELAPYRPALEFTNEQRTMIKSMFAKEASDGEFAVLMEVAKLKRLNPLTGQCHFVSRNENYGTRENPRWGKKWSVQTGIDGFRSKAEENGNYDGQAPLKFEYSADGKTLIACTAEVFRKDRSHSFVRRLLFAEYAQRTKNGSLTQMWEQKGETMLGKCSEAASLRMAFPDELGGLHTDDEMPSGSAEDATPSSSSARPAGSERAVEAEVVYAGPTAAELAKAIADAPTSADLTKIVPALGKFPDGPEKVGLRKANGERKAALEAPLEPGSGG